METKVSTYKGYDVYFNDVSKCFYVYDDMHEIVFSSPDFRELTEEIDKINDNTKFFEPFEVVKLPFLPKIKFEQTSLTVINRSKQGRYVCEFSGEFITINEDDELLFLIKDPENKNKISEMITLLETINILAEDYSQIRNSLKLDALRYIKRLHQRLPSKK